MENDRTRNSISELPERISTLPDRLAQLEFEVRDIKKQQDTFKDELRSLKTELNGIRGDMKVGFGEVNMSINKLTTEALNSLPRWAINASENRAAFIGFLLAMLAAAITVITLLIKH